MTKTKDKGRNWKSYLKFVMWFILLSTLGVGGGIFFLLFAVVPIEETYVQRGWSQYRIDGIMKYYVFGWVIFGFIMSFLYYYFILKKDRWITSTLLMLSSIALCISGLAYFLNTGSSVVQASQGEIEVGERFTFGPYPEKENLELLKEQGYDGVITLLSPTLPIEKPLLDKEIKAGEEADIEIISMPMLPWVGDNTETLNQIKELISQDDKRYYVHCYLGRHRVDVVKQLVNEESGGEYDLLVLQPTSFERGDLVYDEENEVLIGPYPTDEEWFTRIRRGEVKEVVSLLKSEQSDWLQKEQQTASEMDMAFRHFPIGETYTRAQLQEAVDYVKSLDHKAFVHSLLHDNKIKEFEALYSWGNAIFPLKDAANVGVTANLVGARLMVGLQPTNEQQAQLSALGIERFVELQATDITTLYKEALLIAKEEKVTYIITKDAATMKTMTTMLFGVMYGFELPKKQYNGLQLTNGVLDVHERNLTLGPILTEEDFTSFVLPQGVKQIIFLNSPSTTSEKELKRLVALAKKYNVTMKTINLAANYEQELVPLLNAESGLNYVMIDPQLMQVVRDYIKQF
ncbi:hypothetical protein [Lysinibacillus sp. 54212]|uniref:hypothetical protein n=1 Tax=Lysinibacillus sp. 54212 TaxID=3119829 RepID=UPI002FC90E09